MPRKHPNTCREGGPGASHENKKQPKKSKPFAELNTKIKGGDPRHEKSTETSGSDARFRHRIASGSGSGLMAASPVIPILINKRCQWNHCKSSWAVWLAAFPFGRRGVGLLPLRSGSARTRSRRLLSREHEHLAV